MTNNTTTTDLDNEIHKTSSITEQIEKIETSGQSHTLILLQKKVHDRKWEAIKPKAHDQLLFDLDKTRRIDRAVAEEERIIKETDPNLTFNPELNENSRKIVEGRNGEFHSRIMNWENKRQEKLETQTRQKKEETEKNESKSVEPKIHTNKIEKDSLVKAFVDSLNQIADQKKAQRLVYGKNDTFTTQNLTDKEDRSMHSKSAQIKKRIQNNSKAGVHETNTPVSKSPINQNLKVLFKSELLNGKSDLPTFKAIIKSELHA